MTDKILKEALDKLTAIEEGAFDDQYGMTTDRGPNYKTPYREVDPNSDLAKSLERFKKQKRNKKKRVKESNSNLHDAAIDLLDDMLASEQYSEQGDVLRYAIKRLQEVGLGK